MNRLFDPLFAFSTGVDLASVLLLLVKFTLLITLVLVTYRFCSRRSASFRHAVLGMGVLATPLVVLCHFLVPIWSIPITDPGWPVGEVVKEVARVDLIELVPREGPRDASDALPIRGESPIACDISDSSAPDMQSNTETGFVCPDSNETPSVAGSVSSTGFRFSVLSIKSILVSLWIVVSLILLIRLAAAWTIMFCRVQMAEVLNAREMRRLGVSNDLVQNLCQRHVTVRIGKSPDQMPLGVGLIRNSILLPPSCRTWSGDEWRSVLLHEQAHFARRDCWFNLVARVQQSILWFHPLSTLLVRMIRAESEIACDDRVIESGVARIDYADVLFQVASRGRCSRSAVLASVTMSDLIPLETRLQSILSHGTPRQDINRWSWCCLSFLVFVFVGPVATAQWFPTVKHEETSETVSENTVASNRWTTALDHQSTTRRFAVTLRDNTSFVGESSNPLQVDTGPDQVTIPFANILSIDIRDPDQPNSAFIQTDDGSRIKGELASVSLLFHPDSRQVGPDATERTIPTREIKSLKRITQAALLAGEITNGVASSNVSYHLRAPSGYDPNQDYPVIFLFHEGGTNSKDYIESVVDRWPTISRRYILAGINGEYRATDFDPDHPQYQYSGVNFVGRGSIYKGFPGTDRESPALVAEAIEELRAQHQFSSIFVSGHGYGGYLAYQVHMNFPELVDGTVAVSGALYIQCAPDAFDEVEIRRQQREIPLAIVHGRTDHKYHSPVSMSTMAFDSFINDGFPMVRYLQTGAGHRFTDLPFDKAIAWLEQISLDDPEEAIAVAETLMDEGRIRDSISLMNRVGNQSLSAEMQQRADAILRSIEKGALPARRFHRLIADDNGDHWIDDFLEFRRDYEFAVDARECMNAFRLLRDEHAAPARKLMDDARQLLGKGKTSEARDLYLEIVDSYFASLEYPFAKQQIASLE